MENLKESVSIIGCGCRFPGGVKTPEEFWQFLIEGKDGITDIPEDRWDKDVYYHTDNTVPGKMIVKKGGFVEDIDKFDAKFFNISPREAQRLDPQQRMLLEVCYEALQDAGQDINSLAGTDVGVFIGISSHDYGDIGMTPSERANINSHTLMGSAASIAANRLSYTFDFRGPSFAVDTACSSSLVATHKAFESIISGECSLAIVGGVNSLIKPEVTISFSMGGFLSPDGICKTFDKDANGYIRSEGAGVLILKARSKALQDRDKIYSDIIGSAVNQDGRTDGITMPSEVSQVAVLRRAYKNAGIEPQKLQYIEAHGTGTPVGDPIEATSIGKVIGICKKNNDKLFIGSVKSNIGHLEPASGTAGLIKTALALSKGKIPPNIHFNEPNPKIDFEKYNLKVPVKAEDWPDDGELYAGVNSFGFGGTNVHIVLKGNLHQNKETIDTKETDDPVLFVLSASDKQGLRAYCKKYIDFVSEHIENKAVSLGDICYCASGRRTHHDVRLAATVTSKKEIVDNLKAFADDETRPYMTSSRVAVLPGEKLKTAFFFSGQGPQWWGMARELIEKEPIFTDVIAKCDDELSKYTDWSLIEELCKDENKTRIGETGIAQPAIFAVQVGLAKVLESFGIKPDAVVGHSVGEVASGYISGMLTFEDAVKVIYNRSNVQSKASGKGRMLAVELSRKRAAKQIEGLEDRVSIAANNGPNLVTLSGDADALQNIADDLKKRDIYNTFLVVDVPFHSHFMEPLKDDLLSALKDIKPGEPSIDLYSTVTGSLVKDFKFDADYWYKNVRQTVLFADSIASMLEDGYTAFVEISCHPILSRYVTELMEESGKKGVIAHCMHRKQKDKKCLLANIGKLYAAGYPVDFKKHFTGDEKFIDLPFYPFQKETFWLETRVSKQIRKGRRIHPHIGAHKVSALSLNEHIWDIVLDSRISPYINDHRVQGPIIFPGAGSCELSISCGLDAFGENLAYIEDIYFKKAIFLPDQGEPPIMQLSLSADSFSIFSKKDDDQKWDRHVYGKIRHLGEGFDHRDISLETAKERCTEQVDMEPIYNELYSSGLMLGPSFRGVAKCFRNISGERYIGEALGEIITPSKIIHRISGYNIHPAVLDACFQVLFGSVYLAPGERMGVCIPVHIDKLKFYKKPGPRLFCYGMLKNRSNMYIEGDLRIFDRHGNLCLAIDGFRCRYIEGTRGEDKKDINNFIYEYRWFLTQHPVKALVRHPEKYLPVPSVLADFGENVLDEIKKRPERYIYNSDFEPKLNRLAAAYIIRAIKELGFKFDIGTTFTADTLAENLKVTKGYIRRLFNRVLEIIGESDIIKKADNQTWQVMQTPENIDIESLCKEMEDVSRYPLLQHEIKMLKKCGPYLSQVFTGQKDPVALLFPDSEWEATIRYYQESYSFRKYNDIIKASMERLLQDLPQDQTIRIIEIGAGTGGVTNAILPVLPRDRTTYTFTDISQMFIVNAKERFKNKYKFTEYKRLDITRDLKEQGIVPHSYDIVVASDVVHATPSVIQTLKKVRQLLAGSGIFIMLEVTKCPWATDLIFGLTEGWWMFSDHDLRPGHPSMAKEKWEKILLENGFADVLSLTDAGDDDPSSAQTVFLAQSKELEEAEKNSAPYISAEKKKAGKWLIFSDRGKTGKDLGRLLDEDDKNCIFVEASDAYSKLSENRFEVAPTLEHFERLITDIDISDIKGIVHLWNLDHLPLESRSSKSIEESIKVGCTSIVDIFNAVFKDDIQKPPRVWIVTSGAVNVGDCRSLSLSQASAWGLGRTIIHEYQHVGLTLIDISKDIQDSDIVALADEMLMDTGAEEVVIRGDARYINRFVKTTYSEEKQRALKEVLADKYPFYLSSKKSGIIEDINFYKTIRKSPKANEVEIEVRAAGLNFKDVMIATGMLPEEAPKNSLTGFDFGLECSGIILKTGADVSEFKPGDHVIAAARRAIGSHVITDQRLIVKKPEHLSFEQAASIPMVYLTAYYSLHTLARIREGEKVLIHSAAGGVGIAALKLAVLAGAQVFASAGSPEKREMLKEMGAKYVFDSRTLSFAQEIMEKTDGEGVDIVLNSLSAEAASKSLEILSKYGRFVEIGKTDIYENKKLELRPFWNNLSYFAVDIDKLMAQRPDICKELLKDIIELFESKKLAAHPIQTYPAAQIRDAFKLMAAAKHKGKVVISIEPDKKIKLGPLEDIRLLIKPDRTYIVTGGFSGLGFATVKWLAEKGGKKIVVISRSGASSEEAKAFIADSIANNIEIIEEKADASDENAMSEIFKRIKSTLPPIAGIINSAMVLDDSILPNLTHQRFMAPIRPKAIGAWNLHKNTLDQPIDFFVNFSSISAQYGNPSQSNYAAANTFLDMMAHFRRANGLAANTISWGVIGEVGFVARNKDVDKILRSQGWKVFTPKQALETLEKAILEDWSQRTAMDVDWIKVAQYYDKDRTSHRFGHLLKGSEAEKTGDSESIISEIASASPEKRIDILKGRFAEAIARILGTSASKLDFETPLNNMGLDSLMANQIRNWIQITAGVDFSMMKIMRGPSITELTKQILEQIVSPENKTGAQDTDAKDSIDSIEKWIKTGTKNREAKIRLFCFPYMAGGASSFYTWDKYLPKEIEVCPVQFPGKEDRRDEKGFESIEELVEKFAVIVKPMLDKPAAFYGHSIGAAIAFETALYLQNSEDIHIAHFFAGAWIAPHLKSPFKIIENIKESRLRDSDNRDKIYQHLRSLEISESILSNEKLMQEMLPSIISDIILGKTYKYFDKGGLKCPITAIAGEKDSVFTPEQIRAWNIHTSGSFSFTTVNGSHIFIRDAKEAVLDIISEKLMQAVESLTGQMT